MPTVAARTFFEAGLKFADLGFRAQTRGGARPAGRHVGLCSTTTSPAGAATPASSSRTGARTARCASSRCCAHTGPARKRIETIIAVALSPAQRRSRHPRLEFSGPGRLAVQREVDQQRFEILYESALGIVHDARQAQTYAAWAVYVFVGYESHPALRSADVRVDLHHDARRTCQAGASPMCPRRSAHSDVRRC